MQSEISNLPNKQPEYVYLIENQLGLHKIGISLNPLKRFKTISLNSGLSVVKYHLSPLCFNARSIEQQLHARFASFRTSGEWFSGVDFETLKNALDGYFNNFVATVETQHNNSPVAFNFNGHSLRTLKDDSGVVWFVAKDVCEALELDNTSKAVSRLDNDEKLVSLLVISGQNREMLCINESGLYTLILRSNKPQAKTFRKWVTSEVLPTIRKTGGYGVSSELMGLVYELQRQVTALQNEMFERKEKQLKDGKKEPQELVSPLDKLRDFVFDYVNSRETQPYFTITEIFNALRTPAIHRNQTNQNQIASVFRSLGFVKTQKRIGEKKPYVYVKLAYSAIRGKGE